MLSVTGDAVLLEYDSPAATTAAAIHGSTSFAHSHSGAAGGGVHAHTYSGGAGEGYGQGINLASSSAGYGASSKYLPAQQTEYAHYSDPDSGNA